MTLTERLFSMRDEKYREFSASLIPTLPSETMIGVRIPLLRQMAREIFGSEEATRFLTTLPHLYFEENCLHAFLIEQIHDFDRCIAELDRFLPYVDNWSTCDSMTPKILRRHLLKLLLHIQRWLASPHVYTARFGIKLLMLFYLDGAFDMAYPRWVLAAHADDYYLRMMKAWYFATALAKQYDAILPMLERVDFDVDLLRKTIRKACESRRISDEHKSQLRKILHSRTDS